KTPDISDDIFYEKKLVEVWRKLEVRSQKLEGKIKTILPGGKAGFVETAKGKSYYFSMRDFKGKPALAQVGKQVEFFLEEGFDAKKGKKTMNATEVVCSL
ncbi:MAG: hypothetical protein LBR66_03745, partial [Candidatus Symbiothrix sp.]|nr:hypothetical protein [Candidatus Symbiothrix sp.]